MPPLLCADRSCKMPLQAGWDFCPYCGADNRLSPGPVSEHGCPDHMPFPEGHCTRCGAKPQMARLRGRQPFWVASAPNGRLGALGGVILLILGPLLWGLIYPPGPEEAHRAAELVQGEYDIASRIGGSFPLANLTAVGRNERAHGRALGYRIIRQRTNRNPFTRPLWAYSFTVDVRRERCWTRERVLVASTPRRRYSHRIRYSPHHYTRIRSVKVLRVYPATATGTVAR